MTVRADVRQLGRVCIRCPYVENAPHGSTESLCFRRRAPREAAFVNAPRAIPKWVRESPVLVALVALLIGLLVVFVIVGVFDPAWVHRFFFGEVKDAEKSRILELIGVGMGGVLLAIGATIANRRAVAMEVTNRGAEDGRRQERLKNAIEHLGHESDSVRLGGAYELFHLARDTEDLRQTVLDILCAHIRRTTGEDGYRETYKEKPSTEVQSLLTLLFVQEHAVFRGCRIDLQGSWLNGAMLERARLQGAELSGAHLQGTILHGAQLQEAILPVAQLQRASLHEAQLQEVILDEAQLQGANLHEAHLQGAILHEAQLQGAILYVAQLQGAYLHKAQLQGAYLPEAQLQGVHLRKAQLQGANLHEAHLQGADLDEAHLQGADLFRAQLQGADLFRVQLQGATCQHHIHVSLKERIHEGIGRESDLSGVTFAGGLSREDVDSIVKNLPDEEAKELREKLEPHVGEPASNELPEGSGAIVGSYTAEEAERWIAEYREATGEV